MKHKFLPMILVLMIFTGSIVINFLSCTHDDQVIPALDNGNNGLDFSTVELLAGKVTSPPTIDGDIDVLWDNAQKLVVKATVPNPKSAEDSSLFVGYVGNTYDVTVRALYDNENIYMLVEWFDNNMDFDRQTWYFNPSNKAWNQENRFPTFNNAGVMIRKAFYEDKLALLWNVNNSVNGWQQSTCWATCHTGLSNDEGLARHYTNGANERVDMWHWKSVRTGVPNGQFDDQYQDNAAPNGRKSDSKTSGGYTDNIQELTITGSSETVKVPKYFVPGGKYYYWITQTEIDNGMAKKITEVDADGLLTYDGGVVDPNIDLEFQREGSVSGPKGIPSIYTSKFEGSRGDIEVRSDYTGSGWVVEIKRKLDTGDTDNVDVNFSTLEDQYFGLAIFDNAALAHAISTNLLLKFDK